MIYLLIAPYALWLFYLAVMNLKRAKDAGKLSRIAHILGLPVLMIGYGLDVVVNLTLCTILFLEPPKEWLVTERLTRHIKGNSWRASLATWLCKNLLDAFDPSGCHCG